MEHSSLNILLVEDHPDMLELLKMMLESLGHRVEEAMSLAEALEKASADSFDLLLSDYRLPDGTGLELMRQLRQQKPWGGICMSGYGEDIACECAEAGFAACLIKPIDIKALEESIQSWRSLEKV